MLRYTDGNPFPNPLGSVKVVNDTEFLNEFRRRANDDYWQTIECIQTSVPSRIGCGEPIIIKYYADLDLEHPECEIRYDYKQFPRDEVLLASDPITYCLK